MKGHFIELTETNDSKLLINTLHIAWIEPHKGGSSILGAESTASLRSLRLLCDLCG